MANQTKPVPEGFHTVTAGLCLKDCKKAIEFYKRAFGATEKRPPMNCPDTGKVVHAELKIGDSILFLADEFQDMPESCRAPSTLKGTSVGIYLYVPDTDRVFNQAVQAGAKPNMKPTDMFWGDRYAQVTDPWGHIWSIATHTRDLSEAEMKKGAEEFFAQAAQR